MNLLQRVRQTALDFTPGLDVTIDDKALLNLAEVIKTTYKPYKPDVRALTEADLLGDLLLGAVNYCYFYGKADYYITGSGAAAMTQLIAEETAGHTSLYECDVVAITKKVIDRIAVSAMPLADRRIAHLRELIAQPSETLYFIGQIQLGASAESILASLLKLYPGFTGDPFLKRALLFIHLLHRVRGLLTKEEVAQLPIPADYQVPKYLAHFGVLVYSDRLKNIIANADLIPAGSRMEIEIRAASIVACDRLAAASGLTTEAIDGFLWGNRRKVTVPYHLTITTDY